MNFNFGEHYYQSEPLWWSFFLLLLGNLISLGIALFIFRRSVQKDKKSALANEIAQSKDSISYLHDLLLGAIKTVEDQIQKFSEFAESIKAEPTEIQNLTLITGQDLYRLHETDHSNLFLSYRNLFSNQENWLHDLKEFFSHTDFLAEYLKGIMAQQGKYERWTERDFRDFRISSNDIPDILAEADLELKINNPEGYSNDPWHIFLNNQIGRFHEFRNARAKTISISNDYLFEIITQILADFENQKFAHRIMNECKKIRVLLNDISRYSLEIGSDFEQAKSTTEESLKFLKDFSAKLEPIVSENNHRSTRSA